MTDGMGGRGRADTYDPGTVGFEGKRTELRTLHMAYGAIRVFGVRIGWHLFTDSRYPHI